MYDDLGEFNFKQILIIKQTCNGRQVIILALKSLSVFCKQLERRKAIK
jgi:hypothetical protein